MRWKYNRYGHVEIWKKDDGSGESDLYLQADYDVERFFADIGLSVEDIGIDDWDFAEDPGYFEGD